MLNKRAYAATVVLPDGRLWILGGAGPSAILDTSEFIKVSKIFFLCKTFAQRGPCRQPNSMVRKFNINSNILT